MSHENAIRTHIFSIPELLLEQADRTFENVQKVFLKEDLVHIRKIVMTGCGYSYAAGMSAKYIFEKIARIPTEIPYSIDASRHIDLSVIPPRNETMFIGVSNSGIVARIAESMERFSRTGATTVAFTGDSESKCARYAKYTVDVSCPSLKRSLPLRGYVMTLLNCYAIAWNIAMVKGIASKTECNNFYEELKELARDLEMKLPEIDEAISEFAVKVQDAKTYEFVGSGTEYAAAWIGRQQMAGQTGKMGLDCSTEDWLHSTFFLSEPEKIGTMLFMPGRSTSYSREREVFHFMLHLKRPLCVVSDLSELPEQGAILARVPYTDNRELYPLVDLIPVSLFAGKICELTGEEYSRGFRDNWDFSIGGRATEFSEIHIVL